MSDDGPDPDGVFEPMQEAKRRKRLREIQAQIDVIEKGKRDAQLGSAIERMRRIGTLLGAVTSDR